MNAGCRSLEDKMCIPENIRIPFYLFLILAGLIVGWLLIFYVLIPD
jgi:hypothetical protein